MCCGTGGQFCRAENFLDSNDRSSILREQIPAATCSSIAGRRETILSSYRHSRLEYRRPHSRLAVDLEDFWLDVRLYWFRSLLGTYVNLSSEIRLSYKMIALISLAEGGELEEALKRGEH